MEPLRLSFFDSFRNISSNYHINTNWSNSDPATCVLVMASFLLVVLFSLIGKLLLATTSTASSSNNNNNTNNGKSSDGVVHAATFVQTQQHRILRCVSDTQKWWVAHYVAPTSPFRILLPEEEDELFFSDTLQADETVTSANTATTDTATSEGGVTESSTVAVATSPVNSNHTVGGVSHFCFLVHGHRGHSRDLSYVQAVMRRLQTTTTAAGASDTAADRLLVHSCTCNEKKTIDGVAAGGERLVEELLTVIRSNMPPANNNKNNDNNKKLEDVTISLWGNSLGGLYARYAISKLRERCQESCSEQHDTSAEKGCYVLDDAYAVHLNIFCTTACPHLGVSGHTFVSLPRRAEIGVAYTMGETGKDLFRVSALLRTMAVTSEFLEPLSNFRKRICYANAYGTDFPVPAATAAFLSASSSYPHHFSEEPTAELLSDRDDQQRETVNSLVIATLHTPAVHECERARGCYDSSSKEGAERVAATTDEGSGGDAADSNTDAELAQMSISLDALGWKKVFVDMSKDIPRIAFPKALLLRRNNSVGGLSSSSSSNISENSSSEGETAEETAETITNNSNNSSPTEESSSTSPDNPAIIEPIHLLKGKGGVVSSKDVAAAVLRTALGDEEPAVIHWPSGHNMMVAFSRSRWSTYMNKAGRPVVDALAKELVHDIFAFQRPQAAES